MDAETIDAVLRLKDEWTPKLNTAMKQLDSFGARATKVGATLSASVTLPLVGFGYAAISAGTEFEAAMNKVEAAIQPPAADMDLLRKAAQDMGAKTVFSSTEAANALTELGKAGFTTQQAIGALPSVLELAVAGQMNMADAASLTSNTMKTFKLNVSDLSKANDILAKAANSSTISVTDLRETFKYVGPVAAATGMSLGTVSAAAALMGEAGIKADQAGTTLRNTLTNLMTPTKQQAELMKELGLQNAYANGKMMPLTQIIEILGTKSGKTAEIMALFGDRAGPGLVTLVEKGAGALKKLEADLDASDGSAKRAAETMMKGLPGAMERMKGSVETAMVAVSKAMEPTIIKITGLIEKFANYVTETAIPAFQGLPQPVQTASIALLGFTAAAGPALLAIGAISKAIGFAIGVLTTVASKIILAGAAFGTLAHAINELNSGRLLAFVTGLQNLETQQKRTTDIVLSGVPALTAEQEALAAAEAEIKRLQEELAKKLNPTLTQTTDVLKEQKTWWDTYVYGVSDATRATSFYVQELNAMSKVYDMVGDAEQRSMAFGEAEMLKTSATGGALGATLSKNAAEIQRVLAQSKAADPAKIGLLDGVGTSIATALPQVIQSALAGGGDAFKASGSAVGTIVTSGIVSNLTKTGSKLVSGALGGMFSAAMPVVGALAGQALGALVGKLFGPSKDAIATQKANQEISQVQAELLKVHGTLANIQKLNSAGAELVAAWNSKGVEGQKHFNDLLAKFNSMLKDQATLKENLANTEKKLLDAEQKRADLAAQLVIDYDQLVSVTEKYGISLEGLGATVQQLGTTDTFKKMWNDLDTVLRVAGPNGVGGALFGMKEELGKAVGEAMRMGTEVPANWKPFIQNLIDTKQLFDENGKAITDITEIKFGAPVKSQFELIEDSIKAIDLVIEELKAAIADFTEQLRRLLPAAAADAAAGFETAFNGIEIDPVKVPWEYAQQGNNPGGLPGFADSSKGFRDFGSGTLAVLHGVEEVRRPGDPIGEARSGSGGPGQTIIVKIGERVIARANAKGLPKVLRVHGV